MFLINGEPLSARLHPEHFKWVQDKQKEIKSEGKKIYKFSTRQRRAKALREDGKMINVDQYRGVSMISTLIDEKNGLSTYDQWSYVVSLNACKPLGDGRYEPNVKTKLLRNEDIFDVNADIELIIFLKYISQNKKIREVDDRKLNLERAEKEALETKAKFLIYNTESPIHPDKTGSDEMLKNIAIAWGVVGVEEMDVYNVMHELWERVQSSQAMIASTGRGYEVFCNEVMKYGDGSNRAAVILAINRGIIEYKQGIWFLHSKGGAEDMLCAVPAGRESQKDEYAIKYVLGDEYVLENVRMALEENSDPIKVALGDKMKRMDLLEEVTKLGHKRGVAQRKSNEELEYLVKNQIKAEPTPV
jgi:hypothetical protein